MNNIDFVVTWVDGSDPAWQKSRKDALKEIEVEEETIDLRSNRYRDMDCLRYWFRGIQKYASWVHKIYFVTCGQIPDWLNTNNEKIVLVNHSDYMPLDSLPTFNSNAIEARLHMIPGLSEQFVYFNDDTFIINSVKKSDFFEHGLPKDTMSFHPIEPKYNDKKFYLKICNDIEIINKYFDFREFVKKNIMKCISPKQGKHWLINVAMMGLCSFRGFYTYHIPQSYLKSTFSEVWEKEPEILNRTMHYKFRNNKDSVNQWLFQYWQYASGKFVQRRASFGKQESIRSKNLYDTMMRKKYKLVCINDDSDDYDFEMTRKQLIEIFEKKFPQKSLFEL